MIEQNISKRSLLLDQNLQTIFLITLIGVMGVASLTPAFPKIARHFNLSGQSIGLLIIVFTLPGVFLTPLLGVLSDRIGRKKVLVPSLFLFGLSGFACTLTNNFSILLLFRFFQGVGAASIGSLNVTLIGDIYQDKSRTIAMGLNSSLLSIATASYPFIGGILASIDWYVPFYLPLMAFPVAVLVATRLNNPEPNLNQKFNEYIFNAFKYIKNKNALILFFASLITFILLYGSFLTYFPFLLDWKLSTSSFHIGMMMSVMSLTTAMVSSQLGRLTSRFNKIFLLRVSFVFYGIALFFFLLPNVLPLFILPLIIYGLGHGMNIPLIQTLLAEISPIEYRGAFMSMNGMLLRLGQTLGPLIMGIVYSINGINLVFIVGGLLSIFMVLPLRMLKKTN